MNVATLDLPLITFRSPAPSIGERVKCALTTLAVWGSFTGALFLGWGWNDLLQLFSHPARATLLVAVMLQLAFSVAQARPTMRPTGHAGGRFARIAFWLLTAVGLAIVASSAFWDRRILFMLPGEDLTRYIGLALFLTGLAINTWRRDLFEVWHCEVPVDGHRRNRKNLLRLVGPVFRPGLVLAVVGLPMVFLSEVGLAGGACLAALMIVRTSLKVRALFANDRALECRLEAA
jgi:hypothetical protein